MQQAHRRAFPVVETVLVVAGLLVAVVVLTGKYYTANQGPFAYFAHPGIYEIQPLEHKFRASPSVNSANVEEWVIRDFFEDRRGGVFLDVGASHYQALSNTYYLETALGWSGIAVEAQASYGNDYAAYRPQTRFVAVFASDVPGDTVQFFVPASNRESASSNQAFTTRYGETGQAVTVPTSTLNVVLDQAGVQHLDFMSMDIELSEPKALAGFDIDRFQPQLVCIEAVIDVRQQILDYFHAHDYVVVGKYLRVDVNNLYFVPARGRT